MKRHSVVVDFDIDVNVTLEFLVESIKGEYPKNKKGYPYSKTAL